MLSDATIQDLKARFPNRRLSSLVVTLPDDSEQKFVVASPTRAEWQRMTDEVLNPDKRSGSIERMVRAAIKYPEAKDVDRIAAEYPAIFSALSDHVSKLAGASVKVESENL